MSKKNHDWSDLPCTDWPPDVPLPHYSEVCMAAKYVTGADRGVGGTPGDLYAVAVIPWLIRHLRFSGSQACRMAGRNRHLTREDVLYRTMVSPAGQAIAHRMTRHLREMRRAELE